MDDGEKALKLQAIAADIEAHQEAINALIPGRNELIKELYATGKYSYRDIEGFAGVSWVTVGEIIKAAQHDRR